ncbi:MAG: hypothetical protein KDA24_15950 [Deltaproteobacteria bacterium]|nr:hypothetical protein [Deltaproteobacteria bacterium]
MRRPLHLLVAGLLAAVTLVAGRAVAAPPAADGSQPVALPADVAPQIIALLADVGYAEELDGGYQFDDIRIDMDTVTYALRTLGEEPATVGRLILRPSPDATGERPTLPTRTSTSEPPDRSWSFLFAVEDSSASSTIADHLHAARRSIARHDQGGLYVRVGAPVAGVVDSGKPMAAPGRTTHGGGAGRVWVRWLTGSDQFAATFRTQLMFPGLLLALLAITAALARWRGGPFSFERRYSPTHLLPVLIQVTVYLYWAMYWPGVGEHAAMVGAQLAFAFAFDIVWSLSVHRRWTASFAPLPVVLSANLFVWFTGDDQWLGFVVVAVALASKSLVRADGRHVFNPSAIGLAAVGFFCLTMPTWFGYEDIAAQLALPPSMIEVIVLAVLVAQLRVPIVLVSISAAAMLVGLESVSGWSLLSPYYPAVLIIILALATDPATIPRTGGGRVLYGVFVGAGIHFVGIALTIAVGMDYWAKVLPIPIANALSPWFDRMAQKLPERVETALSAHRNRAHLVAWTAVVGWGLFVADVKPGVFEPETHLSYETRHVVIPEGAPLGPEGRAEVCALNPAFCEPFRFHREIALWLGDGR